MPGTMFIQSASLAALPTSGAAWNRLVAKSTADPGSGNLGLIDQLHPMAVFAIALRWARDGGGLGKQRVIDEIKAVPGTESSASQPLNPYRTIGAYILAADLVDMPGNTPCANGQTWDQWIASLYYKTMPAGSNANWDTLHKCVTGADNNWGACARTSALAVSLWMIKHNLTPTGVVSGGPTTAAAIRDTTIRYYKRFVGDTTAPAFAKASNSGSQAWALTTYPSGQGSINATTTLVKSGVLMDGVNAADAARSAFPDMDNDGKHYQFECLDSALVMIAMLFAAGYTDAAGWGNSGIKRNYRWFMINNNAAPDADFMNWYWHQPQAANHLYPGLNFPIPSGWPTSTTNRRMLTTHTDWLTNRDNIGAASTWLKVAGTVDPGDPTDPGTPVVVNPTATFALTRTNQQVTATPTITVGSALIDRVEYVWDVVNAPTVVQTVNASPWVATHQYSNTTSASYQVRMRVYAADGGSALPAVQTISVPGLDGAPVAALTVTTPLQGVGPLDVSVKFNGSFDPNGDAMLGTIDWGDGTVQTGQNVAADVIHTHTYAGVTQAASYSLRAWVTAAGVNSSVIVRTVNVQPPQSSAPIGRLYIVKGGRLIAVNKDEIIPLPAGAPIPADAVPGRDVIFRTS